MTDIVFIVDDIKEDGELVTAADKIRALSANWQPNLFDKNKKYYQAFTGNRIKFVPLHQIESFDPNKRYFYFIPMNDWHCTAQQYFFLLSKEVLYRFAENRVGFYFCQDFEMYPNLEFNFFGSYIAWVRLVRDAHAFPQIPIYFSMCAELEQHQKFALRRAFGGEVNFVNSPLLAMFSREELRMKMESRGISIDVAKVMDEYFSTPKQKSYMALTRDPKYHRVTLMHGLRAFNLLDDGYVSQLMVRSQPIEFMKISNSKYSETVQEDMSKGFMPFMQVDEVQNDLTPGIYHGIGGDIPLDHMRTSCYDLVQETATRYDAPNAVDMAVITEKVMKSLMFGRPFMINGGPACLKVLRRWGFKTCDYLFDETYDTHRTFVDRQEGIIGNVAKYHRRHEDIMNIIKDNRATLEYNVSHMMNFPLEDVMVDAILNPWI